MLAGQQPDNRPHPVPKQIWDVKESLQIRKVPLDAKTKMNQQAILLTLVVCLLIGATTGCSLNDLLRPENKPVVTGRVVTFRDSKPVVGATIKTVRAVYNCGWGCTNYQFIDSTLTDANGNFSFTASDNNLTIAVFKRGYFSREPKTDGISQIVQRGVNDFKIISLKPLGRIVVTYLNKRTDQASVFPQYYQCGELVSTGFTQIFPVGQEFLHEMYLEGNCTIDFVTTIYRQGVMTTLKESAYLAQSDTLRKTIEY